MSGTIHLADKYSKAVQERFYRDSVTQGSFSRDWDPEFIGVKTVRFYEVDTAPVQDYTRSGTARFGNPEELTDTLQEYTMTQDKSFTYTIDKGNAKEQFNIKQAGTSLKRQMREVVTPMIDKYRMKVWAENAGLIKGVAALNKSNTIGLIQDASAEMDDALVPEEGRTLYVSPTTYKYLKQSDEFTHADALTIKAIGRGMVGELDGMQVRKVPSQYFPEDVQFMIIRKDSAVSPMKLQDYRIHTDPPGISGDLVEGRVIYDAFVKGTKAKGIYAAVSSAKVVATPTINIAAHAATLTCATSGATILYTTDGSDPTYSKSAKEYDSGSKPTLTAGEKIRCYARKDNMFKSAVVEAVDG